MCDKMGADALRGGRRCEMTKICLVMSILCAGFSAARGNFPSFCGWTNSAVWLWYILRQEGGGAL